MANNFIDELLKNMPQQGAFSPGATPMQNPLLAPEPDIGPTVSNERVMDFLAPTPDDRSHSVETARSKFDRGAAERLGQIAPQAPQVIDPRARPMLGGFEVRGEGAERFALGVPDAAPQAPQDALTPEMRARMEQTLVTAAPPSDDTSRQGRAQQRREQMAEEFEPEPYKAAAPRRGGARRRLASESDTAQALPAQALTEEAHPLDIAAPTQLQAEPALDGAKIPKFGEEGFQFAERGSPQDFFLSQTNDGTQALSPEQIARGQAFAEQQGMNFDPTTGFSQGTEAPTPQGLTTAGGQPLAEFLAGGQQLDPNVDRSDSGAAGEAAMQAAGELAGTRARADGTFAAPRSGEARGPDSRDRAEGELSMADAVDLAGGDRTKARALVVQSRQDKGKEPLTVEQQIAERRQNIVEKRFEFDLTKAAIESNNESIKSVKEAKSSEARASASGIAFVNSVGDINKTMERMLDRSDEFFGSGFAGSIASYLPGSTGHSQMADAEFIQSNAALNSMAELKRLSPTGSTGFGALSQKELEVLQNQFANLNPFVDPDLFRANMRQLKTRFDSMIGTARETHAIEFGQEAADAIYGKASATSTGSTQAPEPQKLTSPSTGGTFTIVERAQ